jgi:hypothetical protein
MLWLWQHHTGCIGLGCHQQVPPPAAESAGPTTSSRSTVLLICAAARRGGQLCADWCGLGVVLYVSLSVDRVLVANWHFFQRLAGCCGYVPQGSSIMLIVCVQQHSSWGFRFYAMHCLTDRICRVRCILGAEALLSGCLRSLFESHVYFCATACAA